MSSSVDAVTLAWVALLQAATAPAGTLDGLQVTDGPPQTKERERLYTYGVSEWAAERADMDGSRDESYTIEMACEVDRPGDSAADARSRAFQILAAVETIAAAHQSISGAAIDDQILPRDHAVSPSGSGEGFLAVVLFGLRVEAFI